MPGRAQLPGSPQLYVNVANVLDKDPPLVPSSALVGGQTNVALYDTLVVDTTHLEPATITNRVN